MPKKKKVTSHIDVYCRNCGTEFNAILRGSSIDDKESKDPQEEEEDDGADPPKKKEGEDPPHAEERAEEAPAVAAGEEPPSGPAAEEGAKEVPAGAAAEESPAEAPVAFRSFASPVRNGANPYYIHYQLTQACALLSQPFQIWERQDLHKPHHFQSCPGE